MMESTHVDVAKALKIAEETALETGEILLSRFGKLKQNKITAKTRFDFVTEADQEAEEFIIDRLRRHFPEHAFYGEESGASSNASEYQWLIDPLDGTKNYIHSFPLFSVSIALRRNLDILCGVVYLPFFNELFKASAGGGAFLNGEPIHVSRNSALNHAMLATGFPHAAKEYLDTYLRCFKALFDRVSAIRRAGSAAIDLAYTACGRFDGFWEFKLNPWDLGAGILLVKEAGGIVTDPLGGNCYLEQGDILAATPQIHKQLLPVIAPLCRGNLGW